MSTETVSSGNDNKTSGSVGKQETLNANNQKDDLIPYSTYQKALNEKRNALAKAGEVREELDRLKQNELLADGKKDDVIDALRKQLAEVKEEYGSKTKAYATTTVKGQIKDALLRKGCVSPDKALRLMEADDLNSIQLDDNFLVNHEDLTRVIDKFQKENEDLPLFNRVSGVNDLTPTNQVEYKEKPKDFSEMSKEELLEEAKSLGGLF